MHVHEKSNEFPGNLCITRRLIWSDINFLLLQFSLSIILLSSSGDIIPVLSLPYTQIPPIIFVGIAAFAKVLKSC